MKHYSTHDNNNSNSLTYFNRYDKIIIHSISSLFYPSLLVLEVIVV